MGIYGHRFDSLMETSTNKYTFKGVEVYNACKDSKKDNIDSDLKVLNKNWNLVLNEVARQHMLIAKDYEDPKADKYKSNLEANKKALKIFIIRYFGDCEFDIAFESDLINKDYAELDVECGISRKTKKFEIFSVAYND